MATSNRDDFPRSVKEKARMRVGGRCSNPSCRVPTTGPSFDSASAVNNIGKAAHISAAAPKGPRFDPNMQPSQRKSINNAIWLCAKCADDIDNDTVSFTTTQLHQWKKQAEKFARTELGKKLPSEEDSVDLLTKALTGAAGKFIPTAIHNVNKATQNAIEALDPRFNVKISTSEVKTCFTLLAKENIAGTMFIDPIYKSEFEQKHSQLLEKGGQFSISASAVTLRGSKIFDEVLPLFRDGEFHFIGPKKDGAIQRVTIISNKVEKGKFRLDDIQGEIAIGEKSHTFTGFIFDGILQFTSTYHFDTKKVTIGFTANLEKWKGRPISDLPFFNKIHNFMVALEHAKSIDLELEVDGDAIFSGVSEKIDGLRVNNCEILRFIFIARYVLELLEQTINVPSEYNAEAMTRLYVYYNFFNGNNTFKMHGLDTFSFDFTAEVDIDVFDTKPLEAGTVLYTSPPTLTIEGQVVVVPPLLTVVHNLKTREGQKLSKIKAGEDFKVVFDPTDETFFSLELASNFPL